MKTIHTPFDSTASIINDPIFEEMAHIFFPSTEAKILAEETRQFLMMQLSFVKHYHRSYLSYPELIKHYNQLFDETVIDIANQRIGYSKTKHIPVPDLNQLISDIEEQYHTFKPFPITEKKNVSLLIQYLESENERLVLTTSSDDMTPWTLPQHEQLNTEDYEILQQPFEEACATNDLKTLQYLLNQYKKEQAKILINQRTADGNYLLSLACELGYVQIVHALLSAGADPNKHNWRGYTAAHEAMTMRPNKDIISILTFLLEFGADLSVKTPLEKRTPLSCAVFHGNNDAVEWLLNQTVDLTAQESPEAGAFTTIHWACEKGHAIILARLLKAGAKPSETSFIGETPLVMACIKHYETQNITKKAQFKEIILLLLNARVGFSKEDLTYLKTYEKRLNLPDLVTKTSHWILTHMGQLINE